MRLSRRPWWFRLLPRAVRRPINRRRQCPATDGGDGTGFCCVRWRHGDEWHEDGRGNQWREGFVRQQPYGGQPCSDCCHGWMGLPAGDEALTVNWACMSCGRKSGHHYRRDECGPPPAPPRRPGSGPAGAVP